MENFQNEAQANVFLSFYGLRVLDLDNLQCGDIKKYNLPYSIDADFEQVVYFDQWELWIKDYLEPDDYFRVSDRVILIDR